MAGGRNRRLHDLGVMVNASFVFGMDGDDDSVFERTVGWAVDQGIETATFHVLTPYPGTALYERMRSAGRLLHDDWSLYDTRHAVYRPARMSPERLVDGYWWAYREFYAWRSILHGAATKESLGRAVRHIAYAVGWKKMEPLWDWIIRSRQVARLRPMLEAVLRGFGRYGTRAEIDREVTESRGSRPAAASAPAPVTTG